MTNIEVVNTINLLSTIGGKRLPVKVGFAISKNIGILEGVWKPYEKERQKLIDTYAAVDEDGKKITKKVNGNEQYVFIDEKAHNEEMRALFDVENEIDNIHMIDLSELEYESDRYDVLTVNEIKALDFMIK